MSNHGETKRRDFLKALAGTAALAAVGRPTLGAEGGSNVGIAGAVGKRAAEAGLAKGIRRVVVDRGGFCFHGRVKAVVDGAVGAGLTIRTRDDAAAVSEKKEEK